MENTSLTKNYYNILANIEKAAFKSGRKACSVRLVAVTKTVGEERIREARRLLIRNFGENRVQEASSKLDAFPGAIWHFIGYLQSNKAKDVVSRYSLIHSLDRLSLASALQKSAERENVQVRALIQVNVSGEKSKSGLQPGDLGDFIAAIKDYSRVIPLGLMTMAPFTASAGETREVFSGLRLLRDENRKAGMPLSELSMGMTNDYQVAIEEGATIVRIGSALFA